MNSIEANKAAATLSEEVRGVEGAKQMVGSLPE
jgi:hypothetical protein